jgi:hypothetical protein
MKIILIPETESEKRDYPDVVEHELVGDFFICGTKKSKEGDVDFNDYSGSKKYLYQELSFFTEHFKKYLFTTAGTRIVRTINSDSTDIETIS